MAERWLLITEKPSVAQALVRALCESLGSFSRTPFGWENSKLTILAAQGHLLRLAEPHELDPAWGRWTWGGLPMNPPVFRLKPVAQHRERLERWRELVRTQQFAGVINGCDAGREGELICREICAYLAIKTPLVRLWLKDLTAQSILASWDKRSVASECEGLFQAARGRAIADWLFGMNASRAATLSLRKLGGVWPMGRVQTATLALCERHLQQAHEPTTRYGLSLCLGEHVVALSRENFTSPPDIPHFSTLDVTVRTLEETIPSPFAYNLLDLQIEMNKRHNWPASRTDKAAQRCYETYAAITYPRTESRLLGRQALRDAATIIQKIGRQLPAEHRHWVGQLHRLTRDPNRLVLAEEPTFDHMGISPTGQAIDPDDADASTLFWVVTQRYLAALLPDARAKRTEYSWQVGGQAFSGPNALEFIDAGWLAVEPAVREQDFSDLAALIPAQSGSVDAGSFHCRLREIEPEPPPLLTDAVVLSQMAHAGAHPIGTAATRAETIATLLRHGYLDRRENQSLIITAKGRTLLQWLRAAGIDKILKPELTATWQDKLQAVQERPELSSRFIEETRFYVQALIETLKRSAAPNAMVAEKNRLNDAQRETAKTEVCPIHPPPCEIMHVGRYRVCTTRYRQIIAGETVTEGVLEI